MALATETEVQEAYRGGHVASRYVAKRFDSELNRVLHDRQVAAVRRVFQLAQPARVLEVAPGPGRLTRDLAAHAPVTCLEFNEGMIEQGRAACGGANWVRGNGFALPFPGSFDVVYSFRFVRHFHHADRARLYAQFHRVLKPGGYLVFDAVNERVSRPLREANPDQYPIYDKLYSADELGTELRNAGFEPERLQPVQRCFGWQYASQVLLGPRIDWLNRLVIRTLETMPARSGLEWIVTCRRA